MFNIRFVFFSKIARCDLAIIFLVLLSSSFFITGVELIKNVGENYDVLLVEIDRNS